MSSFGSDVEARRCANTHYASPSARSGVTKEIPGANIREWIPSPTLCWLRGTDVEKGLSVPTALDSVRRVSAAVIAGSPRLSSFAPLPLRLIVGYGFLEHGIAKAGRGLDAFPALLAALNVPFPKLAGLATIAVEIGGGILILAGALVPLASVPMAIVLLTAMFTVHWQYGFSSIKLQAITPAGAQFGPPGYETALLYLAGLVALVIGGPGPLSVDRMLARRLGATSAASPSATTEHPLGHSKSYA